MHTLPVLGALAERYRDEPLVIIGVHSAKFTAERDPERVREAVDRYRVHHPVVLDADMAVWRSYTVRAWPTLVFVRPDGTIAGAMRGEVDPAALEEMVEHVLAEGRTVGTLGPKAPIGLPNQPSAERVLSFPGKVLFLADGGVAVSDSGHHRILLLDAGGRLRAAVGSGTPGLRDGGATQARFHRPQGLALQGRTLYVADTANHALRAVDLERLEVKTLAGNGCLGRKIPGDLTPARDVALRSPWDLATAHGFLLIAMAGVHQIWAYVPEEEAITVFAGTGRESLVDGALDEATFSQPTGLAADGIRVYVADSESSAVRVIDLIEARVGTLVGKGLFEFGDTDGPFATARLQHCQGVSYGVHGLLVADTYNDKIKRIDPESGTVSTWYQGTGEARLREPAGLCQLPDGRVLVADTNHHRLLSIAPRTREAMVLRIDG